MRDIFIGEWELRKHEGEPVKRVTFTKHLPYTTPPTHKAQAAESPGRRGAGMQNSVSHSGVRTSQGRRYAAFLLFFVLRCVLGASDIRP